MQKLHPRSQELSEKPNQMKLAHSRVCPQFHKMTCKSFVSNYYNGRFLSTAEKAFSFNFRFIVVGALLLCLIYIKLQDRSYGQKLSLAF